MNIVSDGLVEKVNLGQAHPPDDWVSRRLYSRNDWARSFLEAASEPSYAEHAHAAYGLQDLCREAVAAVRAQTVLSFGPGDGGFEADLVQRLTGLNPGITYIPVDISRLILEAAIDRVGRVAPVPVGLLADMEREGPLLSDVLERFAARPVLFTILGCTVANLDLGEARFFAMLRGLMQPGDRLLMDVPLYGPAWTAENDPRLNSREYADSLKRFLAAGLVSHEPTLDWRRASGWFDDRVGCVVRPGEEVKESKLFVVLDRRTGRELLLIRLYAWPSIQDWLHTAGFNIEFSRCSLSSPADELGMGVLLLSRRGETDCDGDPARATG